MDILLEGLLLKEANSAKQRVRIIKPGWGSSGYYTEDSLKEAAHLFEGVKMYWNHPTSSEAWERPERDLDYLAGVLSNVSWMEDQEYGAGLYGEATVFEKFASTVEEIGQYIGVSIRAAGQAKDGEAEGRSGSIIEKIDYVFSVDYVTQAGAGGKVIGNKTVSEVFREAALPKSQEEKGVSEMDHKAIKEAVNEATKGMVDDVEAMKQLLTEASNTISAQAAENKALKESALKEKGIKFVEGKIDESNLLDAAKSRIKGIAESLVVYDESEEGNTIDEEKTDEKVQEAIKFESEYLASIQESGVKIKDFGGKSEPIKESKSPEELAKKFAALGLSESAAKLAANGRG